VRIIAFFILGALALGVSALTLNAGGRHSQMVALPFWFLFIFFGIRWFRPRV
jgi:hypothetical protein